MNAFALEFDGSVWGFSGPRLVSSVYTRLGCTDPTSACSDSECDGVGLLEVERLAPVMLSHVVQRLSSLPGESLFDFHNEAFWALHAYHNSWQGSCIPQPSVFRDLLLERCPQVSTFSSASIYCQESM